MTIEWHTVHPIWSATRKAKLVRSSEGELVLIHHDALCFGLEWVFSDGITVYDEFCACDWVGCEEVDHRSTWATPWPEAGEWNQVDAENWTESHPCRFRSSMVPADPEA